MKTLALLLLLPLFSYSQEYRIGQMYSGTFRADTPVVESMNYLLDSLGEDTVRYDTLTMIDSSTVRAAGKVGPYYFSDIIRVKIIQDTVYTDFLSGGCAVICESHDCIDCVKNITKCSCECVGGTGLCDSRNYGFSIEQPFSNIFREYWIELHGNQTPEK